MRLTLWFLGAEVFDIKFDNKPEEPKAATDKLGGAPFGNYELGFGFDANAVEAKDAQH